MGIDLFAVANRGLEPICAAEMSEISGLQVKEIAYRRVSAVLRGDLSDVLCLRTVDDIFVDIATWREVGSQRTALQTIRINSRDLDLPGAAALVRQVRTVSRQPAFSVTANFVGRRNYTMEEIKTAAAAGIADRSGWRYVDEDHSEINLRIFIEHDTAWIGMRLARTALQRRRWKGAHLPGSLKPPVAAALLHLAQIAPGQRLLDPCCGTGTIPIEAALLGALALGGDLDPLALKAARANATSAGVDLHLQRWNAAHLPLVDYSAGCIVSNLPWGRQVQVDDNLARFYKEACAAFQRVLKPGGRLVLLTSLPDWARPEGWTPQALIEISLFGQNPSILLFQT
ncbi:MAG TPA: methyltransferase domain-containing protein [Levilinea sp.]|nr:methyltransferase domain-containing protein [Levilinea sp.]